MIYHEEFKLADYNPRIIRRILQYLKPYWLLVSLSIFCIAGATAGQLILPVILQKVVDENLRPAWIRGAASDSRKLFAYDSRLENKSRLLGQDRFYPESSAGPYFRREQGDFELYFLIDDVLENISPDTLNELDRSEDVLVSGSTIAISENFYKNLDDELKTNLRIGDKEGIRSKSLYYLIVLMAVLVFSFFQIFLMALAGQKVMKDLRMDLYKRTMGQKLGFLQNQQVGKLVTRVSSDVETINELFSTVLSAIISDIAMMTGVLITLFFLNVRLGLYSLVIIPPVTVMLVVFRSKARNAYRKVRTWVSAVNAYISEHLSGISLVQSFVQEHRVIDEFKKHNKKLFQANIGQIYVFTVFRPLIDILSTISIAVILYFGGSALLKGLVSLGILIASINLIQRFYQPVQDMAEKFTLVQSAMAGSERVFALLDENHLETETGNWQLKKENIRGDLEFRDLCFSYKKEEPVLQNISFFCRAGERIALVGYTGSGKSTIANVLTRLWELDSGSIYLDGINCKDIAIPLLRKIIQPIQQDIALFHMSVRDNLLLGTPMEDDELFAILDEVEVGDFIRALPDGLDSNVAENSENFSAGQLQLLSFARLLIQNPKIIIMDEATANIDTDTEQKLQRALDRIMRGRTSIVIAHRLSTIKEADNILVLNGGKIVECGTHSQLLQRGGLYSNLQDIQFTRTG